MRNPGSTSTSIGETSNITRSPCTGHQVSLRQQTRQFHAQQVSILIAERAEIRMSLFPAAHFQFAQPLGFRFAFRRPHGVEGALEAAGEQRRGDVVVPHVRGEDDAAILAVRELLQMGDAEAHDLPYTPLADAI